MTNLIAASFYRWEVTGKPVTVLFSLDLMDRLEIEALGTIKAVTSRGSEIGGVLGGRVVSGSPPTIVVERFEPVECDHSRGPLYVLSDADKVKMKQAMARITDGGMSVVGFFRSNARRDLILDDEDQALAREFFADPNQICLLVRPFSMKPSVGGFFFWENGQLPETTYREFPFKRSELMNNFEEFIESEAPAPAVPAELLPVAAEARQPRSIRRFKSVILTLVLVMGAGAAYYSFARQGSSAAKADASLALRLETNGGQLYLSWNRNAPVVSGATRATLTITDGGQTENVNLDLATLHSGSIIYSPISDDASFRLEVADQKAGMKQAASVRRLVGRPAPVASTADVTEVELQPAAPAVVAATPVSPRSFNETSLAAHLRPAEPIEIPAVPPLESQPSTLAGNAPSFPVATVAPPPPAPVVANVPAAAARPQPPAPSIRIGGQPQAARLIRQFPPVYPVTARKWHITGVVSVIAVVGKDGRVKNAAALNGPTVLRPPAVDSVLKWIYAPAIVNGEPVESQTQVNVSFHL